MVQARQSGRWGPLRRSTPAPEPAPSKGRKVNRWNGEEWVEVDFDRATREAQAATARKRAARERDLAYPGVPSERTRSTRPLSGPSQQAMLSGGWTLPLDASPRLRPFTYEEGSERPLKAHYYTLDEWERDALNSAYYNSEGYGRPEGIWFDDRTMRAGGHNRSATVTREAYNALTPAQRNALDFNRMLIAARERDMAGVDSTPEERTQYDKDVKEMFGERGGSRQYSPNIVKLLKDIGLTNLVGQDLDEYVSLDRAFDEDEIAMLPDTGDNYSAGFVTSKVKKDEEYDLLRSATNQRKLDYKQIEAAGSYIDRAMNDAGLARWDRSSTIAYGIMGEEQPLDRTPFGWEDLSTGESRRAGDDKTKEEFFQYALGELSQPGADLTNLQEGFREFKFTDDDLRELRDFVFTKADWMERSGTTDPYPYITGGASPEEIRIAIESIT